MNKTETHYNAILKMSATDFEDVDIVCSEDKTWGGRIKLKLFAERWRTPEMTAKLLRKTADIIEEEFIKK